jgi:hypothetical protein
MFERSVVQSAKAEAIARIEPNVFSFRPGDNMGTHQKISICQPTDITSEPIIGLHFLSKSLVVGADFDLR